MLKLILAISTLYFCFNGQAQDITFPKDLSIDPLNYEVRSLKLLSIEQLEFNYLRKDSLKKYKNPIVKYIVDYDTIGRIGSFRYDFNRHTFLRLEGPAFYVDSSVVLSATDSANLFLYHDGEKTTAYNYYKKVYDYNAWGSLKGMHIEKPYRWSGVLDGVFIRENQISNSTERTFYHKDGRIKSKTFIENGVLIKTATYHYMKVWNESYQKDVMLIEKIIYESGDYVREIKLNYIFS